MLHSAVPIAGGDTGTPRNLATRLRIIERSLPRSTPDPILDAGCGAGDYVAALRQRGYDVLGVEYLPEKLARPAMTGLDLIRASIEDLPFADCSFSAVLLNEVLEHVPNDRRGLQEIARVLAPHGRLICFSPNRLFPFETHGVYKKHSPQMIHPAVPGIPYIPIPLGSRLFTYWARNYWPWELRQLLRETGFRIQWTGYVWLTFEGISGAQPAVIRRTKRVLRHIAKACEATPGLRALGTSQVIVAEKVTSAGRTGPSV